MQCMMSGRDTLWVTYNLYLISPIHSVCIFMYDHRRQVAVAAQFSLPGHSGALLVIQLLRES